MEAGCAPVVVKYTSTGRDNLPFTEVKKCNKLYRDSGFARIDNLLVAGYRFWERDRVNAIGELGKERPVIRCSGLIIAKPVMKG